MNNSLSNLSDEELKTLAKWKSSLTKRQIDVVARGFSTKFAYHIVRLALEAEQILITHHLEVDKNGPLLRSIRDGEWSVEKIVEWFDEKEKQLEALYATSTLRHSPDEEALKVLLMNCLEEHYGNLSKAVVMPDRDTQILDDLKRLLEKYER